MNNDNNEVVERRLKALEFWSRHGLSATLDAFGHSRRSLYGWRASYRSAGLAGLDAIERRMGGLKRYLLTFIDEASGFAAALAVPKLDAAHAAHFMACCRKLAPFDVRATITDNGSAFQAGFADYLKKNQIKAYKTWPRTPKMNAKCERFNRTVQEQFVDFHEELLFDDIKAFNQKLADRLVAYNAWRPHKGHRLQTPMQVIIKHFKQHQNNRQLCNLGWTHTGTGNPPSITL